MPPRAPPPASAAIKGKGKEDTSSNNNASTSTNNTTSSSSSTSATQTTNASAAAGAAATQRRQPIGKVIHYFADNQSQGYDGLAFQEAYKTQVLAKVQALQDAKKNEKVDETDVEVKDEDVEMLISLTGLKKDQAREYFNKAKSTKVEDAVKAYLHPEAYSKSSSKSIEDGKRIDEPTPAVAAAA